MAFTEFQFDRKQIKEVARQRAANLMANKGVSDFEGYALGVFERRIAKERARYLDYGPYWLALKAALNEAGRNYGEWTDPQILAAYQGDTLAETLVMADEFRSHYLATYPVGTRQLMLDGESGDTWTLLDPDMEQ